MEESINRVLWMATTAVMTACIVLASGLLACDDEAGPECEPGLWCPCPLLGPAWPGHTVCAGDTGVEECRCPECVPESTAMMTCAGQPVMAYCSRGMWAIPAECGDSVLAW